MHYDELDELAALAMLEELADLYVDVYAEPPYSSGPKYQRQAFLDRTRAQLSRPGFRLITCRDDAKLAGFTLGFTMGPGVWWANATPAPPQVLRASKFAIIELIVDAKHRGKGLGRNLVRRLLAGRTEDFATLAAVREAPAHAWYLRWGWNIVGSFSSGPPESDTMILPLSAGRNSSGNRKMYD